MDSSTLALIAALLGAAGIGGLIKAVVDSYLSGKRAPVEMRKLELDGSLTLVTAAEQLVGSQTAVVAARDAQIEKLEARMAEMEYTLQRVLDELETERSLREEREHELEKQRMDMAKMEAQLRSQSAKIGALKRALRKLGHDPDKIEQEEQE